MTDQDSRRPPPDSFHTVTDPVQGRLLSDSKSQKFFAPFLAADETVAGAARKVGCELHAMLYRVRTFLKAGLLHVVRVERRAGRPIKVYRSAHDAYFIPFGTTPYADLEERLGEQLDAFNKALIQGYASLLRQVGHHGRRLYRDADGMVASDSGERVSLSMNHDDPTWPVFYDALHQLYLPRDEAEALRRELRDLYARYLPRRHVSADESYLLYVFLVPQDVS